jgi:hypothetical protein
MPLQDLVQNDAVEKAAEAKSEQDARRDGEALQAPRPSDRLSFRHDLAKQARCCWCSITVDDATIRAFAPKAVILSGGPASTTRRTRRGAGGRAGASRPSPPWSTI